jgi:preprotein translocase subunit SecA
VAYKNEAYELFGDLMNTIWADFARMIFHVEVEIEGDGGVPDAPVPSYSPGGSTTAGGRVSYSGGVGTTQPSALNAAAAGGLAGGAVAEAEPEEGLLPPVVQQRQLDEHEQIGRNDPCWCGSGRKFKKCHGAA